MMEVVLYQNRDRAEVFGTDAEQYDRARPRYPDALIDDLAGGGGSRILDVGCGTGIAARQFASRGCHVVGIEPDDRMAAVGRRRGVSIEAGRFEEWDPAGRDFDLVISGQAWHWVDPNRGAAKAADVLGPGGRIALFWNVGYPPPEVRSEFEAAYRRIAPGTDEDSVLLGHIGRDRVESAAAGLRASGRFSEPDEREYPHDRWYTRDEWLDHLPTHSDHRLMPAEQRERLLAAIGVILDQLGGGFTMTYRTALVTATRTGAPAGS